MNIYIYIICSPRQYHSCDTYTGPKSAQYSGCGDRSLDFQPRGSKNSSFGMMIFTAKTIKRKDFLRPIQGWGFFWQILKVQEGHVRKIHIEWIPCKFLNFMTCCWDHGLPHLTNMWISLKICGNTMGHSKKIMVYHDFPFRRLTSFGFTHVDQRWRPHQPLKKKPHLEHSNVQESSFQPRTVLPSGTWKSPGGLEISRTT